jgi:hypothetical protein
MQLLLKVDSNEPQGVVAAQCAPNTGAPIQCVHFCSPTVCAHAMRAHTMRAHIMCACAAAAQGGLQRGAGRGGGAGRVRDALPLQPRVGAARGRHHQGVTLPVRNFNFNADHRYHGSSSSCGYTDAPSRECFKARGLRGVMWAAQEWHTRFCLVAAVSALTAVSCSAPMRTVLMGDLLLRSLPVPNARAPTDAPRAAYAGGQP